MPRKKTTARARSLTSMQHRRTRAAILLRRKSVRQQTIADACGVSQSLVSKWLSGERRPDDVARSQLEQAFAVQPAWWDEEPERPRTEELEGRAAPMPAPFYAAVQTEAAEWLADLRKLRATVAHDPNATPAERARVMAGAASTLTMLGRMTGEALDLNEARIVKLPAFQRVVRLMMTSLEPWPEAIKALGRALSALE